MYVCMYVFMYPSSAHRFGPISMKLPEHFESIEIHLFFGKSLLAGSAKRVRAKRVRCEREAQSVRERSDQECECKAQNRREQSDRDCERKV